MIKQRVTRQRVIKQGLTKQRKQKVAAYNRGMSVDPYNRPPSVDQEKKNVSDGEGAQACGE
jgi:hypothetical protein